MCDISVMLWCRAMSGVKWGDAMWNGAWGMWLCAVMQDVKCGCGIQSDVEYGLTSY